MPLILRQQLDQFAQSGFVDQGIKVLAFGLPGAGKSHTLCAVGHKLVESGRSVLFAPAYRLVQELLAAKRDLALPRQLRKIDNSDFLLLYDLGYLGQVAQESEVLFTLIAERYERRSLGITPNRVFSEWERIFTNPRASAAAIDRVIHHTNAAQQRGQEQKVNPRVRPSGIRPPLLLRRTPVRPEPPLPFRPAPRFLRPPACSLHDRIFPGRRCFILNDRRRFGGR